MSCLRNLLFIGAIGIYYSLTSPTVITPTNYPLPKHIKVVETSLNTKYMHKDSIDIIIKKVQSKVEPSKALLANKDPNAIPVFVQEPLAEKPPHMEITKKEEAESKPVKIFDSKDLEKIVDTSNINFSGDFYIKTNRYTVIKKEEPLPSRVIGHLCSIFEKTYFWDLNIGAGLDAQKTRAVLSMLENNKNIKDITVRINHNEALYDCYRLFGDDKVANRNNFFAILFMGLPTSLGGELFAELRRGDYYNPMNQTVVLFSNNESVSGHEIGHHIDYQRFDSDWEYAMTSSVIGVKLFKEWEASKYSDKMLHSEDKWQFYRYLIPAFMTYIAFGYGVSKKYLQKKALGIEDDDEFEKLSEKRKPNIDFIQSSRWLGTQVAGLHAGIATFNACSGSLLGYAAFIGVWLATECVLDAVGKEFVPYEHEKEGINKHKLLYSITKDLGDMFGKSDKSKRTRRNRF